ncbi:alpha/beta hydrolase [Lysinibacillus sphaericus]|uniref:Acetyl esterase n=1 Tax=Lysinibacillus sphaericus OT4b.31 TaxID=1285586 RepID=R7ZFX2_LYSSH|nr:alpha/beta hydrolase [Lysinibacillus sphaericus]EON72973.1 acetyl esterase [Lysinibacillus sphaericus OT4b.31]
MKKFLKIFKWMVIIMTASILLIIAVNHFNPAPFLKVTGSFLGAEYSYDESVEQTEEVLSDNTKVYRNVIYASNYPNNYLDIFVPEGNTTTTRPVLFNIHGGGFAWGDKVDDEEFVQHFVDEGYIVVSMNYALSPDNLYPVPIIQATEALGYVAENAEQYGIDKNNFVVSGGSAGGQLAGQLTIIQTNNEYAEKYGFKVTKDITLKGVILNCALLDITRVDNTGFTFTNWLFNGMVRAYFGSNEFESQSEVAEANVIENANVDFPSTYLTDGTVATFTDQALDFKEKLSSLGIDVTIYITPEESNQAHGYNGNFSTEEAQYNIAQELNFMKKVTQ